MLWFDGTAEEAVQFYLSVFEDGKIHSTTRFPEGSPGDNQPGTVMTIAFELKGQQFVALNGGPGFPFSNAVSLVVNCDSQEEIDGFWEKLAADGGEPNICGWLRDKFGLPWQIVPSQIWDWLNGDDPAWSSASPARSGRWKSSTSPELQRAAAAEG